MDRRRHFYPVPTGDLDQALSIIQPWLAEHGIYSRGRFGAWKYEVGNQDHCFAQGHECGERLASRGGPEMEPTLFSPAVVNSRKNP